jgi:hypothetical protein
MDRIARLDYRVPSGDNQMKTLTRHLFTFRGD